MAGERSRSKRRAGTMRRAIPVALAVACSVPVAAFGTLTSGTVVLSVAVYGVLALFIAQAMRRDASPIGEVHVALMAITAWTALQALPLPSAVIEWLAPLSLVAPRDTAEVLGDALPSWGTLSRSQAATVRDLLRAAAVAAAFYAGYAAVKGAGRRAPVLAAAAAGITAGVLTLAHVVVGAERLYGVYEFDLPPSLVGPLGNQNHLSGFMAMLVAPIVGVALDTQQRNQRGWLLAAAVFCGAMAIAAISRGGILALVVGLATFGGLLVILWRREGHKSSVRRALLGLGALGGTVLMLGLVAYGVGEQLMLDFGASMTDKLEMAFDGLALLGDAPWFGVGRGAFRVAYLELHDADRLMYPENILVQWSAEWGVPATLLLLATLGTAWIAAARRAASATQLGALAGVLAMFVHEQVDFALENLAIAAVAAVLLGAAVAPSESSSRSRAPSPGKPSTFGSFAPGVAATLLTLTLGAYVYQNDTRRYERALTALGDENRLDELDALGRDAMRAHPNEPVFPLILGWGAARRNRTEALSWLNRAMLLAPSWPTPHLVAARLLARNGRVSQAWLEVREAERRRTWSAHDEICLVAGVTEDPEALIRTFEDEGNGPALLGYAAECPGVSPAFGEAIDRGLLGHDGAGDAETDTRVRMARRAISNGTYELALELLSGSDPTSWRARLTRAQALIALHRADEAITTVSEAAPSEFEPDRLHWLAVAHAEAGHAEQMRDAVERLRAFAASSGPRLAANAILLGGLEERLGNTGRAYRAYDDARRLDPDSTALALTAQLAVAEGDHRRAYLALAELCRRRGAGSPECAQADALHERALERGAP